MFSRAFGERVKTNHKKYVNRIGNLTLLSAPLNIQASNNPFARKKKSYKSSSLKITNELAKKNDFKFSHLEQRSKEITKKALTIWNINFDDVELEWLVYEYAYNINHVDFNKYNDSEDKISLVEEAKFDISSDDDMDYEQEDE